MGSYNSNAAFISFDNNTNGVIFNDSENKEYPIIYHNAIGSYGAFKYESGSYFVYIYEGEATLISGQRPNQLLKSGMYFNISDYFELTGISFKAILIQVLSGGKYKGVDYRSYFTLGGPIESVGRLKYIDGCTDSILIHPIKKGDPCLNHLHFPKNISQTSHVHPSHRIGIVAKGEGLCVTPFGNLPLTDGMIFVIKQSDGHSTTIGQDGKPHLNGTHSFFTYESSMDVIAFHPDSDFGAEDENHPMINRTIVDGVSASLIEHIKTK